MQLAPVQRHRPQWRVAERPSSAHAWSRCGRSPRARRAAPRRTASSPSCRTRYRSTGCRISAVRPRANADASAAESPPRRASPVASAAASSSSPGSSGAAPRRSSTPCAVASAPRAERVPAVQQQVPGLGQPAAELGGDRVPQRGVGERRLSALRGDDRDQLGRAVRQQHRVAGRLEQARPPASGATARPRRPRRRTPASPAGEQPDGRGGQRRRVGLARRGGGEHRARPVQLARGQQRGHGQQRVGARRGSGTARRCARRTRAARGPPRSPTPPAAGPRARRPPR